MARADRITAPRPPIFTDCSRPRSTRQSSRATRQHKYATPCPRPPGVHEIPITLPPPQSEEPLHLRVIQVLQSRVLATRRSTEGLDADREIQVRLQRENQRRRKEAAAVRKIHDEVVGRLHQRRDLV